MYNDKDETKTTTFWRRDENTKRLERCQHLILGDDRCKTPERQRVNNPPIPPAPKKGHKEVYGVGGWELVPTL